jgi:hypothetical protein
MSDGRMPWANRSDDEVIGVGRHVLVRRAGEVIVIFAAGAPVLRLAVGDGVGLRVALAGYEATELISQADVAACGLVPEATFHRDCRAFARGGEAALRHRAIRGSKGPSKLVPETLAEIRRLHAAGQTNVAIGAKLGMSERSVRNARRQLGLVAARAEGEPELGISVPAAIVPSEAPTESAGAPQSAAAAIDEPAAIEATLDATEAAIALDATKPEVTAKQIGAQRTAELFLARMGQLEEQSALFPPIAGAPSAGVLLGLSLLTVTGLLEEVRAALGALPNGLYGVRSIVTTLVAMALLRIKRPEQLKGFDPTALGAVVGLARAPEMKTLRGKLALLAHDETKVKQLVAAMAKRHVARAKAATAFLYIDGHVRPYFGDKKLGKTHHAAMRIALPATTDYWVCDDRGAPLLVVVTEGNAAMTRAMPELLAEVREAVGRDVRPTVVFDRGGFSAKLFKQVVAAGFDLLTYRKGKQRSFRRADFHEEKIRRAGRDAKVFVRDGHIRVKGYGLLRCVAVQRPDGKQTHVLTTREDLSVREVLERMFSRWQQENFFKYLDEQYAFDALWTYESIDADPSRTVPNPERRKLDARLAELRRELQRRKALLGDVARTARLGAEYRAADLERQLTVGAEVATVEADVATLVARRRKLPPRVAVGRLAPERRFELARAPMLLGDVVKMTAFHIESMLVAAVGPNLRRAADEARAVVADLFALPGRIEPRDGVVLITLQRAAAPRYTRALQALCDHVNALAPVFPETTTPLRFAVDVDDAG